MKIVCLALAVLVLLFAAVNIEKPGVLVTAGPALFSLVACAALFAMLEKIEWHAKRAANALEKLVEQKTPPAGQTQGQPKP